MTLAPPDRPTVFGSRTIDMRCSARAVLVSDGERPVDALRCQLWAGHGGEHALMFSGELRRQVVQWSGAESEFHAPERDWRSLAWMRGMPVPAWFESDSADA